MSDRTTPTVSGPKPSLAGEAPLASRSNPGEHKETPDTVDLLRPGATSSDDDSRSDRIRARADQLWRQGGQLDANPEDHWLQAEKDVDAEDRLAADRSNAARDEYADDVAEAERRRPLEEFPPFDDPAFSPEPAQPPVGLAGAAPDEAEIQPYPSHPEFTQHAIPAPARQRETASRALDESAASKAGTPE